MAAKDTSVALIASSQTESERQSPFRLEQVRGELAGFRPNPQDVWCPTEFEPLLSEIDAGNFWDCIPKPFNASPARENFRLFAWGVIGVFVPVA